MKSILVLLFSFSLLQAFGQNVKVSGEITNPTSDSVFVFYWTKVDKKWVENRVDSAKLNNGKFAMAFDLDSMTYVQFFDGNEFVFMHLKPGDDINLSLNTLFFDETVKFTGTGADRNNAWIQLYIVEETSYRLLNDKAKNTEVEDTTKLFKEVYQLRDNLIEYVEDVKEKTPELKDALDEKIATYKNRFGKFPKTVRDKKAYDKMIKEVVGQDFLSVKGVDLEGNEKKIEDYYGKLIVLDFWATWCGPCKYEMPFLTEVEKEFHGKVDFLSIGVWCKEDAWREMAPTFGFDLNFFLDKEEADKLKDKYALKYIPRYMILDEEGKIITVAAERPSGDLSTQLSNLLND